MPIYYDALSIQTEAWLIVSPEATKAMAKEQTDRITLDLFTHKCRPGWPRINPLSRDEQPRINRRNQLKRDKVHGLKRVELKPNAEAVEALSKPVESHNMSHSGPIEETLTQQLAALHNQGIV